MRHPFLFGALVGSIAVCLLQTIFVGSRLAPVAIVYGVVVLRREIRTEQYFARARECRAMLARQAGAHMLWLQSRGWR